MDAVSVAETPLPPIAAAALATAFSHVGDGDTPWRTDGLRSFFLYRDLGVAEATNGQVIAQLVKANLPPEEGTGWHRHEATNGQVIAQLVKANLPPEEGTGWHRHEATFHIVLMLKGWARFMYEDKETLVQAGDCVHQRPGIVHYLFDYSPDMEYLEVVSPADFTTIDVDGPCPIPPPTPWK